MPAQFGYNLYNMNMLKSIGQADYNLLQIKSTEDRPYFYGLGMPTKYCCHDGFKDVPEPLE